jgi:hypothetical protein
MKAWVNQPPVPFWMEGNSSTNFWVGQPPPTVLLWVGLKNNNPFFWLFFFFPPKPVLQTYHPPHSRACNPYSPSCIFGGPNTLLSSISRSNAHNSIFNTIARIQVWVSLCHRHRLCFQVYSAPYPLLLVFKFYFTLLCDIELFVIVFLFLLPWYKRQWWIVALLIIISFVLLEGFWYAISWSFRKDSGLRYPHRHAYVKPIEFFCWTFL